MTYIMRQKNDSLAKIVLPYTEHVLTLSSAIITAADRSCMDQGGTNVAPELGTEIIVALKPSVVKYFVESFS